MDVENSGNDIRSLLESAMQADQEGGDVETSGDGGASPDADAGAGRGAGDVSGTVPGVDSSGSAARGDDHRASETPASSRARDATGKFTKTAKPPAVTKTATVTPKPATTTEAPAPKQADASATPTPVPEKGEQSVALKPPQSWKPAAREAFAKAPLEVQQEVARREREHERFIQETAQARQAGESYRQTLAPFENHFRATGVDPNQATSFALRTLYTLEVGTPQQKAETLGRLWKAAGNADAETFLGLVEGGAQPGQQPGTQPAVSIEEQVDRILRQREAAAREQARREAAQRAAEDAKQFAESHEFFEDVRGAMGALMAGGEAKTLEEAYDMAVWSRKDLRGILQQRQAAEAAKAHEASTQRARQASSTVRNQPATPVSGSSSKDVRGAIQAAIALHSGR